MHELAEFVNPVLWLSVEPFILYPNLHDVRWKFNIRPNKICYIMRLELAEMNKETGLWEKRNKEIRTNVQLSNNDRRILRTKNGAT